MSRRITPPPLQAPPPDHDGRHSVTAWIEVALDAQFGAVTSEALPRHLLELLPPK